MAAVPRQPRRRAVPDPEGAPFDPPPGKAKKYGQSKVLDKRIPGADGPGCNSDGLWREQRDELICLMKKNSRPLHYAAGDDTERALAAWVSAYRNHA